MAVYSQRFSGYQWIYQQVIIYTFLNSTVGIKPNAINPLFTVHKFPVRTQTCENPTILCCHIHLP